MCSYRNNYNTGDFTNITKLKRVYSYLDKYESNQSCMLEYLMTNNKFEYINIEADYSSNILQSMTLSHNIEELRYLILRILKYI